VVSKDCRQGRTPLERTSVRVGGIAVCVLWCGVAVAATQFKTWTAMLDYLGMQCQAECCEFRGL
jgi:hypothetical protein